MEEEVKQYQIVLEVKTSAQNKTEMEEVLKNALEDMPDSWLMRVIVTDSKVKDLNSVVGVKEA